MKLRIFHCCRYILVHFRVSTANTDWFQNLRILVGFICWFFMTSEYILEHFSRTGCNASQQHYLAHVIKKPNLRIPNPQYLLLFKWKFDDFFIHFEFDRGDKKTKCIHKLNVIKKIVVNIGDSEFVNLVFRWREQDRCQEPTLVRIMWRS